VQKGILARLRKAYLRERSSENISKEQVQALETKLISLKKIEVVQNPMIEYKIKEISTYFV